MGDQKATALRKRQKIAKASRVMFFWVAGASVVVGASGVLLFVLVQKLVFNEQVLAEKQNTVKTLEKNNSIVSELEDNVRLLNTNQALIDLQTPADAEPVQVVFDALPSTPNAEALGSALGHKDLLGHPDITIESIDPGIVGVAADGSDVSAAGATNGVQSIEYRFTVTASSADKLRALLARMSRSIRAFSVESIKVENSGGLQMTVTGKAYYLPAIKVETTLKKVPDEK